MHGPVLPRDVHPRDLAVTRRREGQRVTLVGALVSLALSALQITAGLLGRSQAMLADGIHSLSDLVTDVVVWVSLRFSSTPPDTDHPWGHGKIETVVSVLVGATLVVVGFTVGSEAVIRLREGVTLSPTVLPLLAAMVAIVAKEIVYRWTLRVGKRIRSQALVANAWHHRSDAFSSIAAGLGIAGAMVGFPWMDPVAAMVVSLFIVKIGGEVIWRGVQDLLERQVDARTMATVQQLLEDDPDVIDAHRLRLRNVGGVIVGDVHVRIDGNLTVRAGHRIADRLEQKALDRTPGLEDLVIHLDPGGDPFDDPENEPEGESRNTPP